MKPDAPFQVDPPFPFHDHYRLTRMPTYTYKREDGTIFEIEQRITDPALTTCPDTGQKVKRIISGGAGLVFKGSGFYLTDYARSGGAGNGADSSSSTEGEKNSSDAKKPASDAASDAGSTKTAKPSSD